MTRRLGVRLGIVIAAAAAVAGGVLAPSAAARPTLARMIGQKLVVAMQGTSPSHALRRRIRAGRIGGVIVHSSNFTGATSLRNLTAALQAAAANAGRPRLMIAVDQEGGQVKQVSWIPPTVGPPAMDSKAVAREQGRMTGAALRDLGVNTDFAPVADVPRSKSSFMYLQGRTFSFHARAVSVRANAFAAGLRDHHVTATMKHFPGLGFALRNTDTNVVRIEASESELAPELKPYRRAVARHVPVVMLANAFYDAYDARHPAALSRRIGTRLLRKELGFRGVTMTDSLSGTAGARGIPESVLAVRAARAGTDMILVTGSESASARDYRAILAAARDGRVPRTRLETSYDRILALKAGL